MHKHSRFARNVHRTSDAPVRTARQKDVHGRGRVLAMGARDLGTFENEVGSGGGARRPAALLRCSRFGSTNPRHRLRLYVCSSLHCRRHRRRSRRRSYLRFCP